MTRLFSAKRNLSILVALAAIFALPASASAADVTGYYLFGSATYVSPGNSSATAVEVTTITDPYYGGIVFDTSSLTTLSDINHLSTDIKGVVAGTNGYCATGGSRFSIELNDGTTVPKYLVFYLTCTSDWTNTGDLTAGTVDAVQLGGSMSMSYADAQAAYGSYPVTGLFIVVDPSNGGQTLQFDNTQVNNTTYTYEVADLSVTKSDSPDPVHVGRKLTYTIPVTNSGPSTADSVVLQDTLPKTAGFGSVSTTQGTCTRAKRVVTCNLGTLASSGTATVTIVVKPTQKGTITNTATATSVSPDPNSTNNTATTSTTVLP